MNVIKLTALQADILDKRWNNPKPWTLERLAKKYGITRERVRQNEAKIRRKMRDSATTGKELTV